MAPVPTQSGVQVALVAFLTSILPPGTEIIEGDDNRVPEPSGPDFIVMTTIRRERLGTNSDGFVDCAFVASIVDTTMTVTASLIGSITVGNALLGPGIIPGTIISSATEDPATFVVSSSQNVPSRKLACGVENINQSTEIVVQLDVHSANVQDASDMAQTIATLFRDDYAALWFIRNGYAAAGITPLYTEDPRQVPFTNSEQQYETRYIVEVSLQANQVVTVPMEFFDEVDLSTIEIAANYAITETDSQPQNASSVSVSGVTTAGSSAQAVTSAPQEASFVGFGQIRYANTALKPNDMFSAYTRKQLIFSPDPTQTQDFLNPPFKGHVFWLNNRLIGRTYGDYLDISINLLVTSQVAGGQIQVDIDVGSPLGPTGAATSALFGSINVVQRLNFFSLKVQTLDNLLANGAAFYITSTVPITAISEAIIIAPISTTGQ